MKSIIVVLSKRAADLKQQAWSAPHIETAKGPRAITRVHNIGELYRQFVKVLREEWPLLKDQCKTAWLAVPDRLAKAIEVIEAHDPAGTLLRYPSNAETEAEKNKSSFTELTIE